MSNEFARLFNSETFGQVLILNDTNGDDQPCVSLKFNLNGKMGVCALNVSSRNSDQDAVDEIFNNITLEKIDNMLKPVVDEYFSDYLNN